MAFVKQFLECAVHRVPADALLVTGRRGCRVQYCHSCGNYVMMPNLTRGMKEFDGLEGHSATANWLKNMKALAEQQFWQDYYNLRGSALEYY